MELHLAACPRSLKLCPLDCGRTMEAQLLEVHVVEDCDQREVSCEQAHKMGGGLISAVIRRRRRPVVAAVAALPSVLLLLCN